MSLGYQTSIPRAVGTAVQPITPGAHPSTATAARPPAALPTATPKVNPLGYMFQGNTAAQLPSSPANQRAYMKRPMPAPAAPTAGTQSGPGILEDRYNSRVNGTDPSWEYGMGRATDAINKQYAARGGYNSSGAMNSLDDMYANAQSQREGQLDQLAGGASGEHQRRLEDMFSEGTGLANGQAGVAGAYDQAAGGAMSQGAREKMDLMLAKAGVDQKTRSAQLDSIFGLTKLGVAAGT